MLVLKVIPFNSIMWRDYSSSEYDFNFILSMDLNGKKHEPVSKFETLDLNVLALSETKMKKGSCVDLENKHLLFQAENQKMKGLQVIMSERREQEKFESLMRKERHINIITLFEANGEGRAALKNTFQLKLTDIVENLKGTMGILGNPNDKKGREVNIIDEVIRRHGELKNL